MPRSVYLYKQTLILPCRNWNSSFGDFNFNLINSRSLQKPTECAQKMVFTWIFLSWKVHICDDILKTDSETFNCDRLHWHFPLSSVQRTPYLTRTLCNKHSIRAESTLSPHTLMPLLLPLNCPLIYCTHPSARLRLYTRIDNLTCEQTCSKMPDWHFWNDSKRLACTFFSFSFLDPIAPGVGATPKTSPKLKSEIQVHH